jgi:predicted ATPase
VDWSYRLLDELAQRVFERMGVFRSAVDLDAVGAVGAVVAVSSMSSTWSTR